MSNRLSSRRRYLLASLPGKKSVLFKTLLVYIGLGSVLIAALSMLLYGRFTANSISEINKVSTDSLKQSMTTFDQLWDALYLYMNKEFRSDSTLIEGLGLTEYSPVESSRIGLALNDIIDTNNAIDSVYLYNENADAVFSNYGTATTCNAFYDTEIVKLIRDRAIGISKISDCAILYRNMRYSYGSINQTKSVITVVFSTDDLHTALIFNVDQSLLQNLIVPKDQQTRQNLLIINREGMVVSDSDPSRTYTNVAGQAYAKRVLSAGGGTGYFIETVEGRKSLVTYSYWNKWDTLGWVFVRIADYDNLVGDLKQLQNSILLVTLAFIGAGIAAAALLLRGVFRPFYRLIELMRSSNPAEPARMGEIEYLGSVYTAMSNDLKSLTNYKDSSRPMLKQEFLYRLLHPEKQPAEDTKVLAASLGLRLTAPKFRVVAFRLDSSACQSGDGDPPLDAAADVIAARLSALECEVVRSDDATVCAIIGLTAGGQPPVQAIQEIQEECQRLYRMSFTVGIGTVEDGLSGIRYSCRTALEATLLRLVYGRGAIIDYSTEALGRRQKYRYPLELEKNIVDAVRVADVDRFTAALNEFTASIEGFAYNEILLAMNQMALILIRSLKAQLEVTHMQEVGIAEDVREVDEAIRGGETLGDIKKWLVDYVDRCVGIVRGRKSSKYNEIIEAIQAYIEENYGDAGLTVDRIAEHVNLSPNYMRALFKDHAGMTVSHFLNELRFKKAAELLVNTALPASRIAGMVGFPEGSYFYSAFKNSIGMSPEEYRKHMRPETK